jgi:hypothetical protein
MTIKATQKDIEAAIRHTDTANQDIKWIQKESLVVPCEVFDKLLADSKELAQIKAEAKPEEFWPGEIVEVRNFDTERWTVRQLVGMRHGAYHVRNTAGREFMWQQCRKLTDSHVLQFRPLAEGERLPEGEWNVLYKDGRSRAEHKPIRYHGDGIIGYAPVKPVEGE